MAAIASCIACMSAATDNPMTGKEPITRIANPSMESATTKGKPTNNRTHAWKTAIALGIHWSHEETGENSTAKSTG